MSKTPNPGFFGQIVEGRRGQILDAALVVFGEKGYEGGTMRQIAALVGVSEPALYRHYEGKEALLVDLVETAGTALTSTAAQHLATADPDDVAAALSLLLHDRRSLLNTELGLMRTMIFATHHNAAAREAFQRTVSGPMSEAVRALILRVDASRGIDRPSADVDAKVHAAISLFAGHLLTARFFDTPSDDDALGASLMQMLGWRS